MERRLYIFHSLESKDESLPPSVLRRPVRIMDFSMKKMMTVKYMNDDSTGTVRGEEEDKKATLLPLVHRVNYSLCLHKNKVYIYGGISEKNEVLNSMEVYECPIYKFQPVKFRGDHTPLARQGHSATVLNQFCIIMIGGSY
mmetsp:Transcript_21674/g.33372  ORF Transcript_21674/g.33372 Transcript_21674/m.33372 type:complete len:141 (+) Transcript_21674:425-847(+)